VLENSPAGGKFAREKEKSRSFDRKRHITKQKEGGESYKREGTLRGGNVSKEGISFSMPVPESSTSTCTRNHNGHAWLESHIGDAA